MTATEAALVDMLGGGDLRAKMGALTHKNLPLSLFLEVGDLGFPAWTGSTSAHVTNTQILNSLGLGVVRYAETPPDLTLEAYNYEYRTDTDVITAVNLTSSGRINSDDPASVSFEIMDTSYTVNNVVIPAGGSQLVWVKWHTPEEEQTLTIDVRASRGNISETQVICKIIDLGQNEPPDPGFYDRNDGFQLSELPEKPEQTAASWSVWDCYKDVGYHGTHGTGENIRPCECVRWKYWRDSYQASLHGVLEVHPDEKVPTAHGDTMGSAYGVNIEAYPKVETNAPVSHTTWAQNAISFFPEFGFETYWRLHDRIWQDYHAKLDLQVNKYSTYERRVHFTPLWYPDGRYPIYTYVLDAWTPAGMLSMNLSDYIEIQGTMYDDWHITPGE